VNEPLAWALRRSDEHLTLAYLQFVGDIVVGRRGEMGRCAVVQPSQAGWLCGTGSLMLKLTASATPDFIWRYLTTDLIRQYLCLQSVGSTMENLNTRILSRVPVPVPNATEQAAICSAITEQLNALSALEFEASKGVQLLRDVRTALISAAVTGQIDVRGLVGDSGAPESSRDKTAV